MSNNANTPAVSAAAQNSASVEVTEWAYITGWMNTNEATSYIASTIEKGTYKKGQIKKGSPRFVNGKDKTEGYEVRVIAVSGIHPELEEAVVGYRKTIEKKSKLDTSVLHVWKSMLKIENIARDEHGQLKVTDKCVWLADGTRIQLFSKKG